MDGRGITVDGIWKKFHRGEVHDSLRDLIPSLVKKMLGKAPGRGDLAEGDFWALRDVSFQVEGGQALGIIGPNGAGKSTILKVLSGIMRPDRGSVEIRGKLRALIEVTAGFHPDLTGRENIYLNGSILGMRTPEIDRKMDRIVDFSGIEAFLDTQVKRYSSGMKARLGFSVAAHMDPEVLLVDEILSVGDLAFQKKCYEYMGTLAGRGVAVVFVSHNMSAISQLCPRTMVLEGGEVCFMGPTGEAQQEYFGILEERREKRGAEEAGLVLEDFEVTTPAGEARRVFDSGDPCRVRAVVRTERPYEQFSLGLSLVLPSGNEAFHTTSKRLHDTVLTAREGDRVELECELRLNLAGGPYTFHLQCHDYEQLARSGQLSSEVHRFQAGDIQIRKTPRFGGIAYLEPTLHLRKVEGRERTLSAAGDGSTPGQGR